MVDTVLLLKVNAIVQQCETRLHLCASRRYPALPAYHEAEHLGAAFSCFKLARMEEQDCRQCRHNYLSSTASPHFHHEYR